MFHNEDILARLRRGEKRRDIQAVLGVSPKTITTVRTVAVLHGWLDLAAELPDEETVDAAIAALKAEKAALKGNKTPQVSLVEPYRDQVIEWAYNGMEAKTIWTPPARPRA